MSRDAHLAVTVSTKFVKLIRPRYSVIAADTLRNLVTLTFNLLTLVSGHTWRVTYSFYIMKLCSRLFVLDCRSRPKYDNSRNFDPHFEVDRGGVEPWWMARWKALAESLLSVIKLLFLSLTVEALQGKTCQNEQAFRKNASIARAVKTYRRCFYTA